MSIMLSQLKLQITSGGGGCTPQEALLLGLLILDRQVEFKLSWKLILRVQSVGEIHPPYPTVSMNLYTQRLCVIGSISPPGEVGQVELNLVPAVIEPHGHGADEGLHPRRALIITCSKPPANIFIIQNLDLKGEVFLEVFNDHHQKGEFDPQGLLGVCGACYVGGADICSLNLQHI